MEGEEEEENKNEEEDEAPPEEPPAEEPEPPPPEEPEPEPEPPPPPEEPEPEPEPPPPEEPSPPPAESLVEVADEPLESESEGPIILGSSITDELPKSQISALTGDNETTGDFKATSKSTNDIASGKLASIKTNRGSGGGGGIVIPGFGNFSCATFLAKRSPYIHNPPQPEERRARVLNPRTPREYIINLREDLADFQETHGLPRTRDYSFLSLGLALAQETARAICSLVLMFAELFPILAIVSLIMRFALDKLIEILEIDDPVLKLKKSLIFALQMLVIIIPLWILIGTIIIPLLSLILSIFRRMIRLKGAGRSSKSKARVKGKANATKGKAPCANFDLPRLFY